MSIVNKVVSQEWSTVNGSYKTVVIHEGPNSQWHHRREQQDVK